MNRSLHPVLVMVPRKASIIFGCIKRSIMYKIKGGEVLLFIALLHTGLRFWLWADREEPPLRSVEKVYPERRAEETSSGGENSQSRGPRMEVDLGLCLFKESRNRKGCLRELGTPSCCSGNENTGLEDHSGTGMSGLTGNLTTRHGARAPYLASH